MKKHWFKITLVFIVLLILTAGCSGDDDSGKGKTDENGESQSGGELQIAYSAQPGTIDPHMTTAVATSDIMRNVYETLVTIDSEHNFQPMLAESYDISDDGKTITFPLREGVLFHNGEEMKAEDVVASMSRWQEKSSTGKDQFEEATFEADGEYTVILNLPKPLSTAMSVLSANMGSFPAIMPKETVESAIETGVEEYIGTGPFQFEDWKPDDNIHFTKYEDYQSREEESDGLAGKKEALVDDIYFNFVTDPSTRVAGMLSGEYDIGHAIPYDNHDQIESSDTLEMDIVPGSTQVITFNKKKGIFKDLEAREALEAAISTKDIMQATFSDDGFYSLNHNIMMPYLVDQFGSDAGKDTYNQDDPEKAKKIIEENGYDGEEVVMLSTRDYDEIYNASVVLQERLEQIGLKVKLEVYDWPTFLEKKEDENAFDLMAVIFGPQPEPTSYLFLTRGPHSGWTEDDEFHDLIAEFRSQPTLDETKEVYDEIAQWNADNIPFIKIGDFNRIAAFQKTVDNFTFVDGPVLWNVSNSK